MNFKATLLKLLYWAFIPTLLAFLLGFLNAWHPLFDSLSNFRVHLLLILLSLMVTLALFHEKPHNYRYLILTFLGGVYLYYINLPFKNIELDDKSHTFKQMQFNLSFRNSRIEEFKKYIVQHPMDVITLQEVTPAHQRALEELKTEAYKIEIKIEYPFIERKKGAYPYQTYCQFRGVGGGAILSKHPIDESKTLCLEGEGLLWTQIKIDQQPITVGSIHLHWPFPYSQQEQIETIRPILEKMPKPSLISGDFNAVSWSDAVDKVATYSHTKVVDGMRWSISLKKQLPLLPFMKLSIDHLLLSEELEVQTLKVEKDLGSDHFPIVSEVKYR